MTSLFYVWLPSAFGPLGLVWQETEKGPRVHRVLLPGEPAAAGHLIEMRSADLIRLSVPAMATLGEQMQRFLEGEAVDFDLDLVALERCSAFQERVLLAEHQIPRGWVSTYGRMAATLGIPGGARAVGRALACNPFPILIPCHRTIRAHGELGGFRGGLEMKRALLELEGVEFSQTGRVLMRKVYYDSPHHKPGQ